MSSLLQETRLELAVFGYLRKLEELYFSQQNYMPDVIKDLIIAYSRNCFAWNTKEHGNGYGFFEDNALQAEKISLGYSFLPSTILSSEMFEKFEWEITIIDKKDSKQLSLMIGFVEYPLESSITDWNTDFSTGDCMYGVQAYSAYSCFMKFDKNGAEGNFGEQDELYEITDGDTFCFRFDFENSKCSFGYNGRFYEDIFVDIPSKIIPTVCIYDLMIFSCTKWTPFF